MSSEVSQTSEPPATGRFFAVIEDLIGRGLYLAWLFLSVSLLLSAVPHIFERDTGLMLALELARTALLLAFTLLCMVLTFMRRPAKQVAAGWQPRVTAIAGSYAILVIPLLPAAELGMAWTAIAVVVMALGLAASIYSLSWLGRSFSMMASARKLVTAGPYGIVRHPLYASEGLMMLGVILANFSLAAVLVGLVCTALFYMRMLNEERVLTDAFPEYVDYSKRVPRIVPRFGR
jgi:protein-S-isoprenylcysteine O-methyltransferase Ste14